MTYCNADAVTVTWKFETYLRLETSERFRQCGNYHWVLYVISCNADAVTVKRKFKTYFRLESERS